MWEEKIPEPVPITCWKEGNKTIQNAPYCTENLKKRVKVRYMIVQCKFWLCQQSFDTWYRRSFQSDPQMLLSDVSTADLGTDPAWYNALNVDQLCFRTLTISTKRSTTKLDSPSTSRKGAASISPRSQIAGYRTAFTGHKEIKQQNIRTKTWRETWNRWLERLKQPYQC
jgi:hypothetical protein